MPAMSLSSVDLPDPFRPTIPKNSPFSTANETSRSACSTSLRVRRKGCSARSLSVWLTSRGISNFFETPSTTTAFTGPNLLIRIVGPVPLFRRFTRERRRVGLRVHEPVSTQFGLDRGRPVDRFSIESFLEQNKDLIRGRVLEVQERTYTDWFGTAVNQSDVLHAGPGNPEGTLVGDLTTGEGIPQGAYDCIILTQTLPFIYDVRAAVRGTRTALKPGGAILATVPGISQISREDMRDWGDWWRFTSASAKRLFEEEYGADNVQTEVHGNLVAACALLYGLAQEELTREELERRQDDYEVIVTIKATRAN